MRRNLFSSSHIKYVFFFVFFCPFRISCSKSVKYIEVERERRGPYFCVNAHIHALNIRIFALFWVVKKQEISPSATLPSFPPIRQGDPRRCRELDTKFFLLYIPRGQWLFSVLLTFLSVLTSQSRHSTVQLFFVQTHTHTHLLSQTLYENSIINNKRGIHLYK